MEHVGLRLLVDVGVGKKVEGSKCLQLFGIIRFTPDTMVGRYQG